MEKTGAIVILITTADEREAQNIASGLLEKRLIACANIVPKVDSIFWWQGAMEFDAESMLLIKTTAALLDQVVDEVKSAHSYDVPEIIALPIIGGNPDYLNWINKETA